MPLRFSLHAGSHPRKNTPVAVALPQPFEGGTLSDHAGAAIPFQIENQQLCFILENLPAGQSASFRFKPGPAAGGAGNGRNKVALRLDEKSAQIHVRVGGKPLTTYHFGQELVRPFFFPLLGPGGIGLTRGFPMLEVEGETKDHKHHRSLWVAHGDVNGCDNWSEEPGHGYQRHDGVLHFASGPVAGSFSAELTWQDKERQPLLREIRSARFHAVRNIALIDLSVDFQAQYGPVRFGDTKEAGICAVRVASSMDGKADGQIENAIGGVGEAECWGRPAHWVDYSGPVDGKVMGVAVFDHPMNLRHPTPWHVRDYGLFAANAFAHHDYRQSLLQDGSYELPAGQNLLFRYRLCLHRGTAGAAAIGQRYHDYVNPPVAKWA